MNRRQPSRGFTLIELLIGVAVIATILVLAAPSFRDFILMQRLKSINAQVVSDVQWARSEAVSRGQPVRVRFQSQSEGSRSDLSCYIVYIDTVLNVSSTAQYSTPPCDCKADAGTRCSASTTQELRTVQIESARSVQLSVSPFTYGTGLTAQDHQAFDPRTGGVSLWATDTGILAQPDFTIFVYLDQAKRLANQISRTGRIKTCRPSGSTMEGVAC